MEPEKRDEMVDQIVQDCHENMYEYEDFVLGCVREYVENWNDEQLKEWFGG